MRHKPAVAGSLAAAALAATVVIRKYRSGRRLKRKDRRVIEQLLSLLKAAQDASVDTTGQVAEATKSKARSMWAALRIRSGEGAPAILQRLISRFSAGELPSEAVDFLEVEVTKIRDAAEREGL